MTTGCKYCHQQCKTRRPARNTRTFLLHFIIPDTHTIATKVYVYFQTFSNILLAEPSAMLPCRECNQSFRGCCIIDCITAYKISLDVCLCVCYLTVRVPSDMIRRRAGMTSRCLHTLHICPRSKCYTAPHRSPHAGKNTQPET